MEKPWEHSVPEAFACFTHSSVFRQRQNLYVRYHSAYMLHYAVQHCADRADRSRTVHCHTWIIRNDDVDRNGDFDSKVLYATFQGDQYHSGSDTARVHLEHTAIDFKGRITAEEVSIV